MKFLANYVIQSRMQAIMVASAFALLSLLFPPVGMVSSATVALVTLRRGATEGGYILSCACLTTALLGMLLIGGFVFPLVYGLILWTPVWLAAVVLRETRQLLLAIEIVILIASIAILGAYLYLPNLAQIWAGLLNPGLEPMLVEIYSDIPVKVIQQSLSIFYHYVMTGLVAQIYVFMLLSGLFLGRWWQAVLYNPGGFKQEYFALQGKSGLAVATLTMMAAALLSSGVVAQTCWNIEILLIMLYAFVGTIILHCTFATMKLKSFLIPFLYVTMLLIPHVLIPVAIVGLTDTWLNLRNKIPNQTSV